MDCARSNARKLQNALAAFGTFASSLVCFVQWLETTKAERRYQFAAALLAAATRHVANQTTNAAAASSPPPSSTQKNSSKRWSLALQLVEPTLRRMARATPRARRPNYPWLVVAARRSPPPLSDDVDAQTLKNAFFYAIQQGWVSSNVLVGIERLTSQLKHGDWIKASVQIFK